MFDIQKNQSGIIWQEAVFIMAVFGVIMLVAGFLLHNAREENRDLKRLSDVKAIQHALELYFYACNEYPQSVRPGGKISGEEACQGSVYLAYVPADPNRVAYDYMPCCDTTIAECGSEVVDPKAYRIIYSLESDTDGVPKGQHMAVPGNFVAR